MNPALGGGEGDCAAVQLRPISSVCLEAEALDRTRHALRK